MCWRLKSEIVTQNWQARSLAESRSARCKRSEPCGVKLKPMPSRRAAARAIHEAKYPWWAWMCSTASGASSSANAADHTSDARDSGVVVDLENWTLSLVAGAQILLELGGVGDHGAKLVAMEAAAFGAGAFRGVEDWTGRIQPDEQRHDRHQRTQHHQTAHRTGD